MTFNQTYEMLMERFFVPSNKDEEGSYYSKNDNKWKKEIDDSKSSINYDKFVKFNIANIGFHYGYYGRLGNILIHPELYQTVPQLYDIKCLFTINGNIKNFLEKSEYIPIKSDGFSSIIKISYSSVNEFEECLYHEVQHGIQEFCDFSRGASEDNVENLKNDNGDVEIINLYNEFEKTNDKNILKLLNNKVKKYYVLDTELIGCAINSKSLTLNYLKYLKSYGEIEARNCADRRKLTSIERKEKAIKFLRGIKNPIHT